MMLEEYMHCPAHCNYCGQQTDTKEWDCQICGMSKGHPTITNGRCGQGCTNINRGKTANVDNKVDENDVSNI